MPERPRLTPAVADVRRAVRDAWAQAGRQSSGNLALQGDPKQSATKPLGLVLVAVSGGADSLALAIAAAFEGKSLGQPVGAVIIDHNLQSGSAGVAEAAADQCRALGLEPVLVKKVRVEPGSDGLEAAARSARYAALDQAQAETGAEFVMLGHTLDDQAETVLLGLARGSGARSLQGMAELSGSYLRPLLAITRKTTEACCTDSGVEFWSDPHNFESRFARVRVRELLMPVFERELGPGIAQALARTASILREDASELDGQAAIIFGSSAKFQARSVVISVSALAIGPALRNRVIGLACEKLSCQASRTHILEVAALVTEWHGQKKLALPGITVERVGDEIFFQLAKNMIPGAC